jgi:hypothetical protein
LVERSGGAGNAGLLLELVDFVLVCFLQLVDILETLSGKILAAGLTQLKRHCLLLDFLVQLLTVFGCDAVFRAMGGQEAHIVDLSPSPLRIAPCLRDGPTDEIAQ